MRSVVGSLPRIASERPPSATQTFLRYLLAMVTVLPLAGWTASANRDSDEKPWAEVEAQLPAFPQPENLVPFFVSAMSDNKFLIDAESLSVASDGVVRFTLVIVSPSGARNISYEGIRCATGESRIYAFGRSDSTWSKARSDQWRKIRENSLNRHHAELFSEYFCVVGVTLRDADEARQVLRQGGHPSARKH